MIAFIQQNLLKLF